MSAVTPPNPSSVFDVKRSLDFFKFELFKYYNIQNLFIKKWINSPAVPLKTH